MEFIADFHVHSKYAIATASDAGIPEYFKWAQLKGISLVGTGDFTHPQYFAEISKILEEDGSGLLKVRKKFAEKYSQSIPEKHRADVRFILSVEISSIYRRGEKTRRVHNLILVPSLGTAGKISKELGKIGNLSSDGRPILGLDSYDLLKIVMDIDEDSILIPAHIWTPYFSIFGGKNGFDAIEECFGDLTDRVFAFETGLSSDPKMNWRVTGLDNVALISNSDAHSPSKLGREANIFSCGMSYLEIRNALLTGRGFEGTIEMFPEEGKYHLAGHREHGVRLTPEEAKMLDNICPVCGKPVTPGVLGRIEELADRPKNKKPAKAKRFESIVPLVEIIAEKTGKGPGSKFVRKIYEKLLADAGNELYILRKARRDEIARSAGESVADGVMKVREGDVELIGGYDGEFGTVKSGRNRTENGR